MCDGIPVFSNNKKALHGTGTSSHSTAADKLGIKEDHYLKSEYHWWDKEFKPDHYDSVGVNILKENGVDIEKATEVARNYIKKNFHTQAQLVAWLKKTPSEWGRLMVTEHKALAKKVNPKLVLYQDKVAKFKKENIEKYNPYQTIKLPTLAALKEKIPAQVGAQVWDQVWATSYWGIKVTLGLPIKHWFFDFLKLGVMIILVQGKVKVFGKKGMFLGEYDRKDFDK